MAGAPLRGQRGFFGRQDTLEWVARELRNPATNALVLFGQRRIGKTSLLLRLQQTLSADTFLPIYFDLQDQAVRPLGRVLADLADTVTERAGLRPPSPDVFDDQGRYFRSTFLPQLYQDLQPRRPVFLLDEFDVLDRTAEASLPESAASTALIPFLRRVMNEDPQPAFVFVVGRRAEDLSLDLTATFKASLAQEIWVLDRVSAEALTRQAGANHTLFFTEGAVARILSLTNCHPYLTQLLCQRVWERAYVENPILPPIIDVADVEATVFDALQVGHQALAWLWNGMSPAERIYAAALAEASEEGQVINEDRVIEVLAAHAARLRTREVELAPRDLVGRRVLEQAGQREYRFAIEMFRRWVRLNKPLRDAKEELDRIEPLADRFYTLGREWFDQRRWERAAHYFRDALEVNPRHYCARLTLGEALLELGQTAAAVTELEQAHEMDRDEARLPLARALVAQARSSDLMGNEDAALAACERALEISPKEQEAREIQAMIWERRARQALQRNDLEAARAAFQTADNMAEVARVEQLIQNKTERERRESEPPWAKSSPEELLQAYYLSLANECRRLPLDTIDPNFVELVGDLSLSLPDVYVDLDGIALDEEEEQSERTWALHLAQGRGRRRTALLHMIARRKSARLVILGPVGSGKTCFSNYLTFLMATRAATLPKSLHDRLVVRFVLRDTADQNRQANTQVAADVFWIALHDDIAMRLGKSAADSLLPHLKSRLLSEGGLVIFDGLDQVPEVDQLRQALVKAIQDLAALLPENASYVVVTARPHVYAARQVRLAGYSVIGLMPFDREQMNDFTSRWYRAVHSGLGSDRELARERSGSLRIALNQWPRLADLASRPLLLTLMAMMHHRSTQLPQERFVYFEQAVKLLTERWERTAETKRLISGHLLFTRTQMPAIGEELLRTLLEPLAFAAHLRQQEEWDRGELTADISMSDVAAVSKSAEGTLEPGVTMEFLVQRAGLLVERGEGIYAFVHHCFQEYLAACCLAKRPNVGQELRRLVYDDPLWWREICSLTSAAINRSGEDNAATVLTDLLPESPDEVTDITETHWRVAAMVGQSLVDLHLITNSEMQPACATIVERTRRWLVRLVEDGQLGSCERAEAGDQLGQLGDPRFDASFFFLPRLYRDEPEAFKGFVGVPSGTFVMGSPTGDRKAVENELGNPAQLGIPYLYWICRYPVTVAQFQAFIKDKGYQECIWWTDIGWAWRNGRWSSSDPNGSSPRPEMRYAPLQWDEQCNYPNRPVCGICWFEAMAYCKWLDSQWRLSSESASMPRRYLIRLATEAEWEKAARSGDARNYPWGDQGLDAERASVPGRIGHTTTVGIYPRGSTLPGLHDMSGNIWEWTYSLYKPYPYDPFDGRNQREAQDERIVRGGAWTGIQRVARCAYRGKRPPDECDGLTGFRLSISPARSPF